MSPWALPLWVELVSILAGNSLVAWAYLAGRMTLGDLLWVYWLQSVAIGLFNFLRMASLRQFSTQGFKQPLAETPGSKWGIAISFLFHYGFFHFLYAMFLTDEHDLGNDWPQWIALTAAGLFIGEAFTFLRHRRLDRGWKPDLGTMMFQPYLRIIPMHLTIIFGTITGIPALIFIPLKIAADVGMLLVEEHLEAKRMKATGA